MVHDQEPVWNIAYQAFHEKNKASEVETEHQKENETDCNKLPGETPPIHDKENLDTM